ncbi:MULTISPECIES: tellurite resistance TerB family protein [unclassified Nostoc]|uniref:tellurite resistance TerB family protein n=1 Tax=unclassified Nostoc TaxID=2593658 RepID=UPI0025AA461B|nr:MULTISPECIES: tellurite resistance TerB family protein [unclassified Nostoc]MDM9580992.1 tellurite resistance TerB family protein [Nostoc sp. GT001]MDZ7948583.1 tellurite resistance TerB family protein [Nostoc sp. EfeVER01]MDZ7991061.1 tellurite resistance TerB family protein [Nostoc sp. EspVER01]
MGLFDAVLGTESQTQAALNPAEAFAVIILTATASDGYLSVEQANSTISVLSRMKLFKSYPNEMMNRLFDKILGILQGDGFNALFNAAKDSLSQELREAAFAVATDLVLAEGIIPEEEKNFLNDLYQALGVSSEIAIQIVEVILIKNRA